MGHYAAQQSQVHLGGALGVLGAGGDEVLAFYVVHARLEVRAGPGIRDFSAHGYNYHFGAPLRSQRLS